MSSIQETISKLFQAFIHWFHIQYTLWSQWVFQPTGKAYQKFEQKMVIFGDDHGLGIGDKMQLGGLPGICDRINFKYRNDSHIRQFWHVFNMGYYQSNTEDWLPSDLTNIEGHKNLFDKVFIKDKRVEGCQLAVMFLGSNDDKLSRLNPQKSFDNIKAIIERLNSMNVTVILMTVPTADPKEEEQSHQDILNELIKQYVEDAKNPKLILGVEIDALNFEYDRADLYHWDRIHFNEKGFDKIFKDLWDILKPAMVKIEFKKFQEVLYK